MIPSDKVSRYIQMAMEMGESTNFLIVIRSGRIKKITQTVVIESEEHIPGEDL